MKGCSEISMGEESPNEALGSFVDGPEHKRPLQVNGVIAWFTHITEYCVHLLLKCLSSRIADMAWEDHNLAII